MERSPIFTGVDPFHEGWYFVNHAQDKGSWLEVKGFAFFDGITWWRPMGWKSPTDKLPRFGLLKDMIFLRIVPDALCQRVKVTSWQGLGYDAGPSDFSKMRRYLEPNHV